MKEIPNKTHRESFSGDMEDFLEKCMRFFRDAPRRISGKILGENSQEFFGISRNAW